MEIYKNLDLKDMEGEIWKDIKEYEGLYQVSNMGRVKSLNYNRSGKEKIMKQSFDKGYLRVGLTKNRKIKTIKVHRLVAIAFIPNVENKPEVDHINTIKTDNRVENLRFVTGIENMNNELTKEKMKLRNSPNKGKKLSDEWRKNISEANKGKVVLEETKKKISKVHKGKVVSEETKKKIKGKNNGNWKGFICIFPNGEVTEEMVGKELGELLKVSESVVIKLAKSGEPYKTSHKRLKHLNGIKIYYAEDYKKLVGDKIAQ